MGRPQTSLLVYFYPAGSEGSLYYRHSADTQAGAYRWINSQVGEYPNAYWEIRGDKLMRNGNGRVNMDNNCICERDNVDSDDWNDDLD